MSGFNHLRNDGSAHMVDVTGKQVTARQATAIGRVTCAPATVASLRDGRRTVGLPIARIHFRHHLSQALALGIDAQLARYAVGLHGVGPPVRRPFRY